MKCNTKNDISSFIKERDEALFSFDLTKVRGYMRRYGEAVSQNDELLMAAICKTICEISYAPPEATTKARAWLAEHHMKPQICYSSISR